MSRELQTMNQQNKLALWAERISECRNSGMAVKTWCRENGICEQTYYKWQRRLFEMAQAQQEVRFAEVTPVTAIRSRSIAVTVRIAGAEADIHSVRMRSPWRGVETPIVKAPGRKTLFPAALPRRRPLPIS